MSFSNERITNMHELSSNPKSSTALSAMAQAPLNAYENTLVKFVEFLDAGEFEKAQAVNNQGQKTYPEKRTEFIFNFALQCMLQGQCHKSVMIFEQMMCQHYGSTTSQAQSQQPSPSQTPSPRQQSLLFSTSPAFKNLLFNWMYAKLSMIQQLIEQRDRKRKAGGSGEKGATGGLRSSDDGTMRTETSNMFIQGDAVVQNGTGQKRVVDSPVGRDAADEKEEMLIDAKSGVDELDQELLEIVQIILEAMQLLQFHSLHKMFWSQDVDTINFQKMKFLMDQILKKIIMDHKLKDLQPLPKANCAEELEIFKRVQAYEEENGGFANSIDFKVKSTPKGLYSALEGSPSRDQEVAVSDYKSSDQGGGRVHAGQYNSQFAPHFRELQVNKHEQAIPIIQDYQKQNLNSKTDTKASGELASAPNKQSGISSEQVASRQIQFSRFKCRDLNGQVDYGSHGYGRQDQNDQQKERPKVITAEQLHNFKDKYEITRSTVNAPARTLAPQDSLNATDMTASRTSKMHGAAHEQQANIEVAEQNLAGGSELYVFQMSESTDDFSQNFDTENCQFISRLERMDQLFGFFSEEPKQQKETEHEIVAFPIRNPLANIKEAAQLAMEELVPDMAKAPPYQPPPGSAEGAHGQAVATPEDTQKELTQGDEEGASEHSQHQQKRKDEEADDDILQLSRVDKCLINMEELEMDVKGILMSLDNSKNRANQREYMTMEEKLNIKKPKFELEDPVKDQYQQLLKNMCNLASDPDIDEIILEAYKARLEKPEIVSTFQKEREAKQHNECSKHEHQPSAAKDILIRTVLLTLKNKKFAKKLGNADSDLKKYFKKRALAIRQTLEIELQNPQRNEKSHNYIDLAGEQIQKLLQVARKKRKERRKADVGVVGGMSPEGHEEEMLNDRFQETVESDEDRQQQFKFEVSNVKDADSPASRALHSSQMTTTTPDLPQFNHERLENVQINLGQTFSNVSNVKILFKKFGLENDRMLTNLANSRKANASALSEQAFDHDEENNNQEEKRIRAQLLTFQCQNNDMIEEFLTSTIPILDFLFAEHAAFFLFQKSYCMTDLFEFCPKFFNKYVEELQEVLTTVPLKFSVLSSDKIDDNSWGQILAREFTYNRYEPYHHLFSKSLRYQSNLDALGREKFHWIEEILRRFNVLSIFNFAFREYLDTIISKHSSSNRSNQLENEDKEDAHGVSRNQTSSMKSPSSATSPVKGGDFDWNETLTREEMQVLQVQYDKKLEDTDDFDPKQVDQVLLRKPGLYYLFIDLCQSLRYEILQMARLETLMFGEYHVVKDPRSYGDLQVLNYDSLDVLVLLSGQLEIQLQSDQKPKLNKQNKRADVKWVTFQILKEGTALPIVFLHKLSYLYQRPVKVVASSNAGHQRSLGFKQLSVPHSRSNMEAEEASARLASGLSEVEARPVTFLRFNHKKVGDVVFGPLKRSLYRKVEAQAGLDFMYNSDLASEPGGMTEGEQTSPFVMLIMAIVCQVKISKYSETVVKKGEVPKALHLIVDGQADAVLEDFLPRSPKPSQFCRGVNPFARPKPEKKQQSSLKEEISTSSIDVRRFLKMERPEPPLNPFAFFIKERKEILKSDNQFKESAAALMTQLVEEWKAMSRGEKDIYTDLAHEDRLRYDAEMQLYYCAQVKAREEAKEFERQERMNQGNRTLVKSDQHCNRSGKTLPKASTQIDPEQLDDLKMKKLHDDHAVKGQLEFKKIKMGDYFSSRALIDDASVKNYVKGSKQQLTKWLRLPRKARVETVIRKFCLQMEIMNSINGKLHSYQDLDSKVIVKSDRQIGLTGVLGELLDHEFLRKCQVNFRQKPVLEKIAQTRRQFHFAAEDAQGETKPEEGQGEKQGDLSRKQTQQGSSEQPSEYKARVNDPTLTEYQWLTIRPRLFASQLSIIVQSHELKCMLIKKQDKLFFGEQIKKIFDEKMLLYEFRDVDRPVKALGDMEEIRLDYRKWDLFKRQYEHLLLEKHYHKRKELFTLKSNNNK